jgi:cell division protein FtsB
MFGIGGIIKAVVALVIVLVIASGLWYVTGLRADLAVSEENTRKMSAAVEQQTLAINQLKADQAKIQELNRDLNDKVKLQTKDLTNLQDRFNTAANGDKRDIGSIAVVKPESIARAINNGTVNALRCVELASGSPLTEKEKNAKLPSEINKECPSLSNPNYKPAAVN